MLVPFTATVAVAEQIQEVTVVSVVCVVGFGPFEGSGAPKNLKAFFVLVVQVFDEVFDKSLLLGEGVGGHDFAISIGPQPLYTLFFECALNLIYEMSRDF